MWSWKTQLSNFKTRTQQFILHPKIRTPRRLFPLPKVNQSTPSRVNKSKIYPHHQTGKVSKKKSSGVIFVSGRPKPRPVSTTNHPGRYPPGTWRKATLPRARFTIRNCGLAGSEKRMIKALESCPRLGRLMSRYLRNENLVVDEIAWFFFRDPYVMVFFIIIPHQVV